ncbi:MAG: DUF3524 domain-containing protein [Planctomycetes bacterium]|nr:DUF3524 domain-containing protein [Planctomycetota bacterium]MBL7037263.1 DUF3524 domain-containing protein [Pirellulaceae bacterium]
MVTHVLALNAYHGGSHRAFLEGWSRHSRHRFTKLSLPPHKWKWRMRHAAVTFAEQVGHLGTDSSGHDVLFCTDMLNLAEFRGLCPPEIRPLPTVVYFHENQLTYPTRHEDQRDLHFAFTNMTTALAADRVWFNSAFHRDEFLAALAELLGRMPDFQPTGAVAAIRQKSAVHPPGVESFPARGPRPPGPLRILWVSRWEHDKNPQAFFDALDVLLRRGGDFRVSVLGESFDQVPDCFEQARRRLTDRVDHWGFLPDRDDYHAALAAADVVVSTADHEFFGIGVLEAVAAGCFPLAPKRLAYPEVLSNRAEFLYDGSVAGLAERLLELAGRIQNGRWPPDNSALQVVAEPYLWKTVTPQMDEAILELADPSRSRLPSGT